MAVERLGDPGPRQRDGRVIPGLFLPPRQDTCLPSIPSYNLSWELPGDEVNRNRGASHPTSPTAAGRAAPRLTLYGGGGTNQGATSPFRFEALDARLTPRAPRALIGCARRRTGREGRADRGEGGGGEEKGGGEVVAGTLEAPLATRPCSGARPPAFPPQLVQSSVRAEGCDRPACLAP